MKDDIILTVKEAIAAHACVQERDGEISGLILDDIAVDNIAKDIAEAVKEIRIKYYELLQENRRLKRRKNQITYNIINKHTHV